MSKSGPEDWRGELEVGFVMAALIIPLMATSSFLEREFGDAWPAWVHQTFGAPGLSEEQVGILLFNGPVFVLWMAGLAIYFRVIKPRRKRA